MQHSNNAKLLEAAKTGNINDIYKYLSLGADINTVDEDDFKSTPLRYAATNGFLEAVKLLVKNGANINNTAIEHASALRGACANGHSLIVKYLINHGAFVDAVSDEGNTGLHYAAWFGHTDVGSILLDAGANANIANLTCGSTPLIFAAQQNQVPFMKLLLTHGADVNIKNNNTHVLMIALKTANIVMLQTLLNSDQYSSTDIEYMNEITESTNKLTLFLTHLKESAAKINVHDWYQFAMRDLTIDTHANNTYKHHNQVIHRYLIATLLYKYENNHQIAEAYVKNDITVIVLNNKLEACVKVFGLSLVKNTVLANDHIDNSILHFALENAYVTDTTIDLLLSIFDNKPTNIFDAHGNSLFRVNHRPRLFQLLFDLLPDKLYTNHKGHTLLHFAACKNDDVKVAWLLSQNIEYPTPIRLLNILRHASSTLTSYLHCKESGQALLPMPVIKQQKGPCCGLYAINCAIAYLYCKQPNFYQSSAPPARKSDSPTNTGLSLRHIAKKLKMTLIGELYSVTNMSHLIEEAGFSSLIVDISDYEYFLFIIRTAISLSVPVIIPFSSVSVRPLVPPLAEHAHWATIIGIMNNPEPTLLLAEYGMFNTAPAKDYFQSCYDMPEKIQERRYAKKEGRWMLQTNPMEETCHDAPIRVIPETNLTDYRRKLLLVTPPNTGTGVFHKNVR